MEMIETTIQLKPISGVRRMTMDKIIDELDETVRLPGRLADLDYLLNS